ncbi:virulence factor MVIN family protein [Sesbania bispinosa]|nr:virulence factor MVIN family protein [Sesbania bispinosa]
MTCSSRVVHSHVVMACSSRMAAPLIPQWSLSRTRSASAHLALELVLLCKSVVNLHYRF